MKLIFLILCFFSLYGDECKTEIEKFQFAEKLKEYHKLDNIHFLPIDQKQEKTVQPINGVLGNEFDPAIRDLVRLIQIMNAEQLSFSDLGIDESNNMVVLNISKHVTHFNLNNKPNIKAVTQLLRTMPEKMDLILDEMQIKTDKVYKRLDPSHAGTLYRMIAVIHKVFKEHNIPYWAVAGTYLGALRQKGIIPWDDDGDIQILLKDSYKLTKLANVFSMYGYELAWKPENMVAPKLRLKAEFRRHPNPNFPSVDIFIAMQGAGLSEKDRKDRYYYSIKARKVWPNEFWEKEELFQPSGELNLKEVEFGPVVISVVNAKNAKRYCWTAFGKECFDWAKQTSNHDGSENNLNETFLVTQKAAEFSLPPEWGQGEIEFDRVFYEPL